MLDYPAIGRLPPSIQLSRNHRPIDAVRVEVGNVPVDDGRLWITDDGWEDQLPPLPIVAPVGGHPVYAYQWRHPSGDVNVCAVVWFREQVKGAAKRLRIKTHVRPDLDEGVIVDSAAVAIRGSTGLTLRSGLGDGYYPIIAVYNSDRSIQAVIADFNVWEVRKCIMMDGWELDEYAMPRPIPGYQPGATKRREPDAARERYRQQRLKRISDDIAAGAHSQGPPCPACGRPLRTAKARQCFLCGYKSA